MAEEIPEAAADLSLAQAARGDAPLVLRGRFSDWPLVQAARQSSRNAAAYLRRFANDAVPVTAMTAPASEKGRIGYGPELRGFNFRNEQVSLTVALNTLIQYLDAPEPPMIYLGATTLDTFLPGLRAQHPIELGIDDPLASIWIGNRTRVPAHQDLPENLACVCAGRRRVTLLPPDQLANLYVGPLDVTPAGQPISLVDFAAPDITRFPRFGEAMRHARTAILEPGDAVFIPSMWWHHMEALDGFNVLINYWWRRTPEWMETPMNALMHALLSIRDLPAEQRATWQEIFRHYVFEPGPLTTDHIPDAARGILAPLDDARAATIRARLAERLAR
ncbi:cupin-like domain-containing protein [Luteimonas sp. TWI1437]|uniref:cupin-like domain-containing protein n=1 Tax=unclassified Luteimonas TaxID=2629088 RepID=UPI003207C1B6